MKSLLGSLFRPTALLRAGLFALTALVLSAQEVVTAPFGFIAQTIPAGQSRPVTLPLLASVDTRPGARGTITAVGTNYIENATAGWPAGEFSDPDLPFFVRITSGAAAGRIIRVATPANTASRLYLNGEGVTINTLGLVAGPQGDGYEILPADTLDSLFGSSLLQGGATAAVSDTVSVWGGASYLVFYYNTTRQRWERDVDNASAPSRGNYVLRPDRGILITRRGATPLSLVSVGRVSPTATPTVHQRPGSTLLATMWPVDVTLAQLALESAAHSTGWTGAANPTVAQAQADLIQVWGGAAWVSYYYDTTRAQWQRAGDATNASANDLAIVAGSPIFVRRIKAGGTTAADKSLTLPAPDS